jgi:UDP-2-acetamido-2-deoxy-ribo-hexuluronate aminotransferase
MPIQLIDLQRQYQAYRAEIDQAIQESISTASFIMGEKVAALEKSLAAYVGTRHAIACASGTDALLLALKAYGIGPGDEVITTPFTFISTAEVVSLLGARPVFVDIDEKTYNIDPALVAAAITPRTRGIIVVDLFGQCADYKPLVALARSRGLFVIEDGAQSFGATYEGRLSCSLADIGCTSFFPAKPLGCYGDGGMIFVDDDQKAAYLRSVRVHGSGKVKYEHELVGMNSRLDALQAAILAVKFRHFPDEIEARLKVAAFYGQALAKVCIVPYIVPGQRSVYAQYCIRVERRDELQAFLKTKGIPSAIYYPKALHLQPAFKDLGYQPGDFPVSEKVCRDILGLPMHPFLKRTEQDVIIEHLCSWLSTNAPTSRIDS